MIVWMNRLCWFWLIAAIVVLLGFWTNWIEHWEAGAYSGLVLLSSLAAFTAQGLDKWRANADRWRISERWLHFFELIGGWPGAHFGQQFFRHKTAKASYRNLFYILIFVHIAAIVTCLIYFSTNTTTTS